ncbi:tRNA (cytidine(34)-2'-O)-methyltransferase [Campylobacterota bacterium]|nr:tRNA (cytidine(34)-2'-O)-methyltransferase [Campylobacterota bacterium]
MFEIVLLNPKIPQNVGAIGRSCVCAGARLNVIAPTPIDFGEKRLRRAGLDYWRHLDFAYWDSLDEFLAAHPIGENHYFFTTKCDRPYFRAEFRKGDFLWFGGEDCGLPEGFWRAYEGQALSLPMRAGFRSLNLATVVSAAIYEGIRQNYDLWKLDFGGFG